MNLRNLKIWLACLHMGFASALLFVGHAQSVTHQFELKRANVILEFDYFPIAIQWLAALYAPSGLLTVPIAIIPGIPKITIQIWFVLCVGAFWYWLSLQAEPIFRLGRAQAPRKSLWGQVFNCLGLLFALVLSLSSGWTARHGGLPLLVDVAGFLWGFGLMILFLRNIRNIRKTRSGSQRLNSVP